MVNNDKAVSPIVGLAFMIMIIGIISWAVLSVLVPVVNPKIISMTPSEPDNKTVSLTYIGGKDSEMVTQIRGVLTLKNGAIQTKILTNPVIGDRFTFNQNNSFSGNDTILVFAKFKDGSEYQVGNFLV